VGVGNLVNECADLAVGGSGGDDDVLALGVAPAAGPVLGETAHLDGVAELRGVRDEGGDQVAVAVADDWLGRRRERHRIVAGQRVGHRDVPHAHGAEEDTLLASVLAVVVATLDGDRGEDPDRGLPLANAAVQRQEGPEAGDVGRGDAALGADHVDDQLGC
jgi:hypothetical protein